MLQKNDQNVIEKHTKGFPHLECSVPLSKIGSKNWNLLKGDVPLPCAILKQSAIQNNSDWMRRFAAESGVLIAPHGKTTMSPELFIKQLSDGAWGITVATVQQVKVCRENGISRILLANQLLQKIDIDYIVHEMNSDTNFEFFCLVDSIVGVQNLAAAAKEYTVNRPLSVLLEVGVIGGRTGCRDKKQALEIAAEIHKHADTLNLCGVEGFEGLIKGASPKDIETKVIAFLDFVVEVTEELVNRSFLTERPLMLSAGGSSYFDLVVDRFKRIDPNIPSIIVLRSGCYIAHDARMFKDLSTQMFERNPALERFGQGLEPALEIWAMVQSRPEPEKIICAIGKRDVGIDAHYPTLEKWFRSGKHHLPQTQELIGETIEVNDHHCHLKVPPNSPLAVGDYVCFGISHPCTTFDRWNLIYMVDDSYQITSAIKTFF